MSLSGVTEQEFPEPRDILYINVSRIGDTLLVTPAVRAVAARWPRARIHLLAHPKREEVVRYLPFVYRTGGIEKQRARFIGRLPGKSYDLAFVCNFDTALIQYALRVARRVVAFRQRDEALNRRLYRVVEHPALQTMHAVDIQLLLPAAVGAARALANRPIDQQGSKTSDGDAGRGDARARSYPGRTVELRLALHALSRGGPGEERGWEGAAAAGRPALAEGGSG